MRIGREEAGALGMLGRHGGEYAMISQRRGVETLPMLWVNTPCRLGAIPILHQS